jgi:hypothetical protein
VMSESYCWTAGSGRINLFFRSLEDAQSCSHPGRCDADVEALMDQDHISEQLAKIAPDTLREELREYGAWDSAELADHDANLMRLVWIAACDVAEDPDFYRED